MLSVNHDYSLSCFVWHLYGWWTIVNTCTLSNECPLDIVILAILTTVNAALKDLHFYNVTS